MKTATTASQATKIDEAAAEQCGKMAFDGGKTRAPALDAVYCEDILGKYTRGAGLSALPIVSQLGTAWLRGFDQANA